MSSLQPSSQKPSLRDRLFSTSSKKSQKQFHDSSTPSLPTPDDPDREQGSLNTTLTANNRRIPFYRRKAPASAGALSSSTAHSVVKMPPGPSRSRPSFLSRVVTKVVPCVGATPDTPLPRSDSPDTNPSFPMKDLSISIPSANLPQNGHDLDISPPIAAGFTIPPSSSNPPSPTDSDIVVLPPVSAALLPEDETDGMTSGAVQPPGSHGTEIVHVHSHDSSEDSEHTSFTDDESEHQKHDEQDEEEQLMKSGGSGIPIGPVCFLSSL